MKLGIKPRSELLGRGVCIWVLLWARRSEQHGRRGKALQLVFYRLDDIFVADPCLSRDACLCQGGNRDHEAPLGLAAGALDV